jgi:hypothetical protein
MSNHQNDGQNYNLMIVHKSLEKLGRFKYLGMAVTNKIAFMKKLRAD